MWTEQSIEQYMARQLLPFLARTFTKYGYLALGGFVFYNRGSEARLHPMLLEGDIGDRNAGPLTEVHLANRSLFAEGMRSSVREKAGVAQVVYGEAWLRPEGTEVVVATLDFCQTSKRLVRAAPVLRPEGGRPSLGDWGVGSPKMQMPFDGMMTS